MLQYNALTSLLKIRVFCDVTPCRLVDFADVLVDRKLFGLHGPENESTTAVRNVGNFAD